MNTPPRTVNSRICPEESPFVDRYVRSTEEEEILNEEQNEETNEQVSRNLEEAFDSAEEEEEDDEEEEKKPKVDTGLAIAKPIFALPCDVKLDQCPICFEDMEMVNITVTTCGHTFHSHCAFNALMNKTDCPLCRHQLIDVPEEEDMFESDEEDEEEESDEDEDGTDADEDEYDTEVTIEQLGDKLNYMGYTMADVLNCLVAGIPTSNRERYASGTHLNKMFDDINGIITGEISLSSRDNRSYASVLAGKATTVAENNEKLKEKYTTTPNENTETVESVRV
jgi:hypothetical protein